MAVGQRITAIEVQEKRPSRRSVFLDGKFALGLDESVVQGLHLHVGQQVSEEDLQRMAHLELAAKARERAFKLLEYRQRSKAEIVRKLRSVGFADDIISETTDCLEKLGLVDDEKFAQSWVNHRLSGKPMGKARIKWELRQKGVATDVAENAVSSVDADTEHQAAIDAARRRWERDRNPDPGSKRRRLASYLRRQGFDWENINRVLHELAGESPE